jgi:fused signal recognition particle receptor
MDNLPIVLVVVAIVAALVYFLFFRKKALPEEGGQKAAPSAAKAIEKLAQPEPRKEGKEARPAAAPPTPEPLPSAKTAAEESVPAAVEPTTAAPAVASKKDVAGLRKGLAATRGGFMARLKALFAGKKEIDPAILEQMEEVMISSDVGVKTRSRSSSVFARSCRRTSSPTPMLSGPPFAPRRRAFSRLAKAARARRARGKTSRRSS